MDDRQRSRDEERPRGGSQGMPFAKIEELQKVAYENRAGIRELRSRFLDLARQVQVLNDKCSIYNH